MTLLGMTQSYADGTLTFADDLAENIAKGDQNYLSMLDEADAYIARNNLDLPLEPGARDLGADPDSVTHPIKELNFSDAAITSVIWATGFAVDFS